MRPQTILIALFMLFLGSCSQKEKVQDSPADNKTAWLSKMNILSHSLSKLIPLSTSHRVFDDPKNQVTIKTELQNLVRVSHSIEEMKNKGSHDPSLEFTAKSLSKNLQEAGEQLEAGNRLQARKLIRQTTSYCISCHTRTDQGRENLQLSAFTDLSQLEPVERADYYIAVRDYDRALNAFDKIINSPDAQMQSPKTLEVAAEKALAIAVRVKKQPTLALELASRIVDSKWAPVYLRMNALTWKKSIEDWKKGPSTDSLSAEKKLIAAKKILAQGWQKSTQSPQSLAGMVHYLQASSLFHDILNSELPATKTPEALYYAGLTAESLKDINLWVLQDAYYEACIYKAPRSEIAQKCYLRLEALQYGQYTTLEGAYLPKEVETHLRQLKELAVDKKDQFLDWGMDK